uniref:Uncharacterized protein n=2 Tax=Oryza sativa subsp. japonica TaxID=39947 RepID=Q94HS5_ORYSJ|nr:Putative receptor protein kinase [Oryza sativa]AAP52104.1 hypothetical protein LOC_Os10g05560 [Oryza sativa Japonica Group]
MPPSSSSQLSSIENAGAGLAPPVAILLISVEPSGVWAVAAAIANPASTCCKCLKGKMATPFSERRLLDNNKLSGSIPSTLGLLNTLEVLRFDNNAQLTGPVPTNLNNLTRLTELLRAMLSFDTSHLANCNLTGPLPDLTGMNELMYLYMNNNSFSSSLFE